MSEGYARFRVSKKGQLMSKICVFCENVYSAEVMVCQVCEDYKGLMPIGEAVKAYDFLDYLLDEE